jgi:hypothetical protein
MALSDVALENAEALASDESVGLSSEACYNTITTMVSSKVLYCGTCTYINKSTKAPFSSKGTCP